MGPVDLPIAPPLQPMLAKAASGVPEQPADEPVWSYEPKWDGFRAIVFRDGADVVLGSRGGKDLARYFRRWSTRCARSCRAVRRRR